MCHEPSTLTYVRIMRCPHGTTSLTLGCVTLHLTDPELILLDRAIHRIAKGAPLLQESLYRALRDDNASEDTEAH